MRFVSICVVHPYSSIDAATAQKKFCFILSYRSDFHIIDNLLNEVHSLARRILISLSVDEIFFTRYMNLSSAFRGLPLKVEIAPSCLKHALCFICVHVEANPPVILKGFGLGWCICKKHYIICIVCICESFRRILPASCFFFFF